MVSIRWQLQQRMREPQPGQREMADIEAAYERLAMTWESHPELRQGRSNIINLNLVITQFIGEYMGQRAYDAHFDDFNQVGAKKWTSLFAIYCRLLRADGRRAFCPVKAR